MIQRIQSVYLVVATVLMMFAASVLYVRPEFAIAGYRLVFVSAAVLIGVASFGAIFFFANRSLQYKMVGVLRLLTLIVIVSLVAIATLADEWSIIAAGDILGVIGFIVAPTLALIATHLAQAAIKRDIELIKSVDRLR